MSVQELDPAPAAVRRWRINLGLDRFGGLYVWLLLIVGFSIWMPDTFATTTTLKLVLSDQAITGMLAVGILLPFAAGLFDLSFASIAGFAMVTLAWLGLNSSLPEPVCVLIAIAGATAFGALNGLFVVRLGLSSFVVTLAMSSIVIGLTAFVSAGGTIQGGLSDGYRDLTLGTSLGIPNSFWFLVVLAGVVWYVLEKTPLGRRLFAVGGNAEAARLTGIRVGRLWFWALVTAAAVAGVAGAVLAGKVGIASDAAGPAFLLPAVAAVLLGSTQIKNRFNVLGTLVAVYLLATIAKGLQLAGSDPWVISFFNGVALLAAVSIAAVRHKRRS